MTPQLDYDYTATPDELARQLRAAGELVELNFGPVPLPSKQMSDSYRAMCFTSAEMIRWALAHPLAVRGSENYRHNESTLQRMDTAHPLETMMFFPDTMLTTNGEQHRRIRNGFRRHVTPRKMREFAPEIRSMMQGLLDNFDETLQRDGKADYKALVAQPLPTMVTCRLLGMSTERSRELAGYVVSIFTGTDPTAVKKLTASVDEIIQQNDLSPGIIQELLKEGKLERQEFVHSVTQFIIGGVDTTLGLITSLVKVLAEQPEWIQLVYTGKLNWDDIVQEGLRRWAPAPLLPMLYFKEELEIREVSYPKGTPFLIAYHAGNLGAEWVNPEVFDPMRSNAKDNIAFGYGPHMCVGMNVALAEARIALEMTFERFGHRLRPAWESEGEVAPLRAIIAQQPTALPLKSAA